MAPIFTGRAFGFGKSPEDVGSSIPLITSGGTILTPGNGYTYHVFTYPNSDNLELSTPKVVNILLVAGGGGGGNYYGAGGGAGGIVYGSSKSLAAGLYPVQVGSPGDKGLGPTATPGSVPQGGNGGDSYLGTPGQPIFGQPNYVLAKGGGGGGSNYNGLTAQGISGGSGGGSGGGDPSPASGQATQPGTNPALTDYGNPGGYSIPTSGYAPAGGGGAGGSGASVTVDSSPGGGNGGPGTPFGDFPGPLIGPAIPAPQRPAFIPVVGPTGLYGGGGGAGLYGTATGTLSGLGGPGGGGNGQPDGNPGIYGTGGGGGGRHPAGPEGGGNGGAGIVIVRYPS